MKKKHWHVLALLIVIPGLSHCSLFHDGKDATVTVSCDSQSLADEIEKAEPGATVRIDGTCEEKEPVVVTEDGITLDGEGGEVKGVPGQAVIKVVGATDVTLKNFTATGGKHGVVVLGSPDQATLVRIVDVSTRGNEQSGLCVVGAEPTASSFGKAPKGQSQQELYDKSDRCVADLASVKERTYEAPYSQQAPVSSKGLWNTLVSDAVAQESTPPLIVMYSRPVCSGTHKGNSTGISVWGSNVTLSVTGTNCVLTSSNNQLGLFVGGRAKVKLEGNARLELTNNGSFEFLLGTGLIELFDTSQLVLAKPDVNYLKDSASNVFCAGRSSVTGDNPALAGC